MKNADKGKKESDGVMEREADKLTSTGLQGRNWEEKEKEGNREKRLIRNWRGKQKEPK